MSTPDERVNTGVNTDLLQLLASMAESGDGHRCVVAPSPQLREEIKRSVEAIRSAAPDSVLSTLLRPKSPQAMGLNDGLIIPGSYFPLGTAPEMIRSAAASRAPLRGKLRVIIVLVDFPDLQMDAAHTQAHFQQLFFSTGALPNGSVRDYYREVTNGLIDIDGQVVGPFRVPHPISYYANGNSGTGNVQPNARTLAHDAAVAADPQVNFGPYDNDGNGYVDAFIVLHAGPGGESTGNKNHIWSHKWVLPTEYTADTTKIYAYLTVPEDAKIGVCCHELGHLLFGWPDLYDTDYSSEGIGDWCLMAGGSWNGGGDVPAHPSAWCKANQGWVSVINQTTNTTVHIADVKDSHAIYRLWKNGSPGQEFFLAENRQRTRFDQFLPGEGLLIWHIDESIPSNTDERHCKVALMQSDGKQDMEHGSNRGDAGDPYPGTAVNASFTSASSPSSKSYAHVATSVAVTNISKSGPVMTARLAVRSRTVKPHVPVHTERGGQTTSASDAKRIAQLEERLMALEKRLAARTGHAGNGHGNGHGDGDELPVATHGATGIPSRSVHRATAQPFIDASLRPDVASASLEHEEDLADMHTEMLEGSASAKRQFDSKLPEG